MEKIARDILLYIFDLITKQRDIINGSLVCKKWREILKDSLLTLMKEHYFVYLMLTCCICNSYKNDKSKTIWIESIYGNNCYVLLDNYDYPLNRKGLTMSLHRHGKLLSFDNKAGIKIPFRVELVLNNGYTPSCCISSSRDLFHLIKENFKNNNLLFHFQHNNIPYHLKKYWIYMPHEYNDTHSFKLNTKALEEEKDRKHIENLVLITKSILDDFDKEYKTAYNKKWKDVLRTNFSTVTLGVILLSLISFIAYSF